SSVQEVLADNHPYRTTDLLQGRGPAPGSAAFRFLHRRTHPSPMNEMSREMTVEQEVPEMNLTALLGTGAFTQDLSREIPCQQEDPELWFAETPNDVEFAK